MTSWRNTASVQTQQDFDTLLDAALGFAQKQLISRGEFFPYAVVIDTTGRIESIAARPDTTNERPTSTDVVDSCVAAVVSQRDFTRACSIVTDVRLQDLGSDAIQVDLEHVDGHALTVLLPYTTKRPSDRIEYGQLRALSGQRRVWV